MRGPLDALEAQRGQLFGWVPVAFALGIGGYFALRWEPEVWHYGVVVGLALCLLAASRPAGERWALLLLALAVAAAGFTLAGARAHLVAEPKLGFRYYGPVQGRVVAIDRSLSDKVRLTLDRVVLEDMAPERTPARVRVSLHGRQGYVEPEPGLTVILTGHLSPPQGPVEPGGFDFRRMAWFDRLGAVGYTRTPVLAWAPAEDGRAGLALHRLRMGIAEAVRARMPGEAGAFAAAIMTGDRSGISRATLEDLRRSNLAHLLAISGLHMGLLAGFVFASLRYGMALVPPLALRWPVKKIAAAGGIAAGFGYYLLSGGNVATERAFVMVAVMLVAVLLDRRALTLRAVAIAALIVLAFRPETLTEPGFQMSFAATTALVAVFGVFRDRDGLPGPRWLRPVLAVVISSAVAGAATAPVAAAHFNRFADYGLIANLSSVPLMGLVVMPAAVLTACLAPFGLEGAGLALMRPAIEWILGVAAWVAGLDGSVTPVVAPPGWVLPALALGALWLVLWRGRLRLAGLAPMAVAVAGWSMAERPPVLIAGSGGLVGVLTEEGRALSKPRGDGFAALSWLENDGDPALQDTAHARGGFGGEKGWLVAEVGGQPVVHLSGRGAAERVGEACRTAALVVLSGEAGVAPCPVVDRLSLRETGALAVFAGEGGLEVVAANARTGRRLWSR